MQLVSQMKNELRMQSSIASLCRRDNGVRVESTREKKTESIAAVTEAEIGKREADRERVTSKDRAGLQYLAIKDNIAVCVLSAEQCIMGMMDDSGINIVHRRPLLSQRL